MEPGLTHYPLRGQVALGPSAAHVARRAGAVDDQSDRLDSSRFARY